MYGCWSARGVGLDLPAEESIEIAAKAGFEGVDLLVRDVLDSGADVDELRRKMDDLGLRGGGWTLPMNWKNEQSAFEADLKRLPRCAEVAARLGLYKTGTWVRFESEPVDDDVRASTAARDRVVAETTAWQIDRLGRIARILGDHGSRLGLEIIGSRSERSGRGVPLVGTYAELLRRFGELREDHANIGILVDAYHLFAAGERAEDALAWGVSSVVWVHLADPANLDRTSMRDIERALPGDSNENLCRQVLVELARQGYAGPVTAEPLAHCRSLKSLDPLQQALRTRASLQRVWPDSGIPHRSQR